MLKDICCNLCGSSGYKVVYEASDPTSEDGLDYVCTNVHHGEFYRVVKCDQCGLLYCSPRPDFEFLEQKYNKVQDDNYKEEVEGRKKTFKRSLLNLSKYRSNGAILDVGCALGVFLSEAKKEGWDVYGVEPSQWCVKQCKEIFDLNNVVCGTSKDILKFGRKFDVITMWDVLEHLDDPLGSLKNCSEVLKEDGVFAFSTVNVGSLYAKVLGRKWPWFMKMHIYYFDKKSIKAYLSKAGFDLIEMKVYKHIVSIDYLLYKLKNINGFLFSVVKLAKKIIFCNKNVFVSIGMGDFMEVYARKAKQ